MKNVQHQHKEIQTIEILSHLRNAAKVWGKGTLYADGGNTN